MAAALTRLEEQWRKEEHRQKWYDGGAAYWSSVEASNDGVLGGYGIVHEADIRDSLKFISKHWETRKQSGGSSCALDVGAGIGRITDAMLLSLCDTVDLLEGCEKFVQQARVQLAPAGDRVRYIGKIVHAFPIGR